MRYVVVNPGANEKMYGSVSYNVGIEPPYWVALKAAILREAGYDVRIIDADAENLSPLEVVRIAKDYKPDAIEVISLGITPSCSSTPKMTASTEILLGVEKEIPERYISGIHPSALVVRTEGETHSKVVPVVPFDNIDDFPIPAWDLLPMDKYRTHQWHCWGRGDRSPYGSLYSSYGCPFNCSFCTIHKLYDFPTMKYPSVDRVIQELDILHNEYGITNVRFIDELFVARKDRAIELCKKIKERNYGLNMWAFSRVDLIDEEIVNAMLEAGFGWQVFGIESVDASVRNGIGKKFGTGELVEAIELVRRLGAHVVGDFIFGLPDDDHASMRRTLDFARENLFEFVNFYVAMAYPGSDLYYDMLENNVTLPDEWSAYSQYSRDIVPLPTKHLTGKEVLSFRDNAFIEYYSAPDYLEMMEREFGGGTVEQIKELLTHKLEREILNES